MRFIPTPRVIYMFLDKYFKFSCFLMIVSFITGVYVSFFISPPDYQQGDSVRIMYIHVPASWMSLLIYGFMFLSSLLFLVWKHPIMGIFCRSLAPIGTTFTIISLITGSIWGKPMWGVWWVWDARLTSVLILLFLYLGYMGLTDSFEDYLHGMRMGSLLCLLGAVNLPVIKWSVKWWSTLHQPSSFQGFSSSIHTDMLLPLFIMFLFYSFYSLNVLNIQLRIRLKKRLNL